jgi:hypothetical protein
MTYGSNILPSKFGRGKDDPQEWTCICDKHNRRWHKKCQVCGIDKDLAKKAIHESKQ